jgi:large conductance mechanosensitive channel
MLREFRQFLMRGNLVELAVAFVAGVAFTAVVTSLVNDVIMQVVAAVVGRPDFSGLTFTVHDSEIRYGSFLTALVNFVLTMGAVFFLVVKPVNAMTARLVPASEEVVDRECPSCRLTVSARATRCPHCTSELQPVA